MFNFWLTELCISFQSEVKLLNLHQEWKVKCFLLQCEQLFSLKKLSLKHKQFHPIDPILSVSFSLRLINLTLIKTQILSMCAIDHAWLLSYLKTHQMFFTPATLALKLLIKALFHSSAKCHKMEPSLQKQTIPSVFEPLTRKVTGFHSLLLCLTSFVYVLTVNVRLVKWSIGSSLAGSEGGGGGA